MNFPIKQAWLDLTFRADLKKANPRCKKCHGTGKLGRLLQQGRVKFGRPIDLVCPCIEPPKDEEEEKKDNEKASA